MNKKKILIWLIFSLLLIIVFLFIFYVQKSNEVKNIPVNLPNDIKKSKNKAVEEEKNLEGEVVNIIDSDNIRVKKDNRVTQSIGEIIQEEIKSKINIINNTFDNVVLDAPSIELLEPIEEKIYLDDNGKAPEDILMEYFTAGTEGDVDKAYSLVYHPYLGPAEIREMMQNNIFSEDEGNQLINDLRIKLKNTYEGGSYYVSDKKVESNFAIITVWAMKNGLLRPNKTFFLIKENNLWKINLFGFNHSVDAIADDKYDCNDICLEKDLFRSGNVFSAETKECICWYEPPETENLDNLNVLECEGKDKTFKESCYINQAKVKNSEEYCKKVSSRKRNYCYSAIAKKQKNLAICDNLWDDKYCISVAQ